MVNEPLGALDLKLREATQDELKSLQRRLGITFVFVTHDQHQALSTADSLAVFNEGRIAPIGTPEQVYSQPRTRFVADFVGSSNLLPPAPSQRLGGAKWSSLRPETLHPDPAGALSGTVTALRYLGACHRISLSTEIAALLPNPGDSVRLGFAASALRITDKA